MRRRVTDGGSRLAVESVERIAETFLAPFMIHEALPTLTETAFGSHPCCNDCEDGALSTVFRADTLACTPNLIYFPKKIERDLLCRPFHSNHLI